MGNLKADAMREAYLHCAMSNRDIHIVKTMNAQPPYIFGNFPKTEIIFKCINPKFDRKKKDEFKQKSSGTGFIISKDMHILTNEHVVNNCSEINVKTNFGILKASIIAKDQKNDLAVILVSNIHSDNFAKFRSGYSVRVGEEITVAGYPFGEILGASLKATSGSISSSTGLGNDSSMLQIDAAIQPGNSGGPLLDSSGLIVGIITSKLDEIKMARLTGSLPQNVNFAIKNLSAISFLTANNIPFKQSLKSINKPRPDVVKAAGEFTVMIQCN